MTKVSKTTRLLITLVLLALAFFCSFNVTYSYFTATANADGELAFADLDVRFITVLNNSVVQTGNYTQDNLYTINLYPVGGTISRGQAFKLSSTNFVAGSTQEEIDEIRIKNMTSTKAYVRFWIDAYIVTNSQTGEVDTTTNYGKYFFFTETDLTKNMFARGGGSADAQEGSWCYFAKIALNPYGQTYAEIPLGNELTMKDIDANNAIPNDVLGAQLKVTLSLQAVQASNGAFSSVFGGTDKKGYYLSWS